MDAWTAGWIAWIGWFLVEEALALTRGGTRATLSGHVWAWFGINNATGGAPAPHPRGWTRARRFALAAFLAWLCLHLLTGGAF